MKDLNQPKKSAIRYVKKSQQKPKPVVIPILAKQSPRPHRCGACRFYDRQNERSHSKLLQKLGPYLTDPTIVPHYEHSDDFADPEYKFHCMRKVYMVNCAKKAQELAQLRKQLQQVEEEKQKLQAENTKLKNQINGTTPLSKPRNPKPANQPACPNDRHQCPNVGCKKFYKNQASFNDHIRKCGKTWICPDCKKVIMLKSRYNHSKKSCKAKQQQFSFF